MDFQFRASKPVAGVGVVVRSGDRSWRTLTDREGKYELTGVATEIEAVPPARQPRAGFQFFTGEDGPFEHTQLEAGEYIIGFNLKMPPNARDWFGKHIPYPGSYYPGVTERGGARVLRLGGGEIVQNLEFRVPPRGADLVLAGQVLWPDGAPAEADVWLADLDFPGDSSQVDGARTKAGGSFSLTGIEGRHYAVFAHLRMEERHVHSAVLEMRQKSGKPIRLELRDATSETDCPICRRFKLRGQSPLW